MLALLLYTGGRCNYDLCASQRSGDYEKWKVLDFCMDWAILELSQCETFRYPLFSGLENVKFEKDSEDNAYFATYLSASKSEDVAITFRGKKGLLLEFEKGFKSAAPKGTEPCADVSWISKFPDEMTPFWPGHRLKLRIRKGRISLRVAHTLFNLCPMARVRPKWKFCFDEALIFHGNRK